MALVFVLHPLFSVSRTPALHTGMNLLVCNMAVSDMVMCLTAAPLTPITSFTGRWFLGHVPCIILPACQVSGIKIALILYELVGGIRLLLLNSWEFIIRVPHQIKLPY